MPGNFSRSGLDEIRRVIREQEPRAAFDAFKQDDAGRI